MFKQNLCSIFRSNLDVTAGRIDMNIISLLPNQLYACVLNGGSWVPQGKPRMVVMMCRMQTFTVIYSIQYLPSNLDVTAEKVRHEYDIIAFLSAICMW